MTTPRKSLPVKPVIRGRPDYYLTPTQDFTQYTRDSQRKFWNQETQFDWQQNVEENLKSHLEQLDAERFAKIAFMVLPMIADNLREKTERIRYEPLPMETEALQDIGECLPQNSRSIEQALAIQSELKNLQTSRFRMRDRLEILNRELRDLREQQRLGMVKSGATVKYAEAVSERQDQALLINQLSVQIQAVQQELKELREKQQPEMERVKARTGAGLKEIEQEVLKDLEAALALTERTVLSGELPVDATEVKQIRDLILKRQLRALKDIANHALVVEQSAIAPLSMGIIHYKRYREIQEAMATFIHDEAKHSATFRRFLAEKLQSKEFISHALIKGSSRYMWLARFMPGAGMFLAVIVEAIGAAYLELFGKEEYMPDPLFCSISRTISEQDETRHMDLCAAIYNELFRKGSRWERYRNQFALKMMLKSVYGDKTDDHHLIQAFRAFGVESDALYHHVVSRLSEQLARISVYVSPRQLLQLIGRQ